MQKDYFSAANIFPIDKLAGTNYLKILLEDLIDLSILVQALERKRELLFFTSLMLSVGTVGYVIIEGWPVLDALYMVIITMTTIGYGEVKDLSEAGRVFTMILIVFGVIIGSYAISTVIESFTSESFRRKHRYFRRRRKLRRVNKHTIICGYGRLGRFLAHELLERKAPLIVIDLKREAVDSCDALGIPAVHGNAADENILHEAGVTRATALVTAAKTDAENLFIILTARTLNPNLEIVSRCNAEQSVSKLKMAGAQTVLSPYAIAATRITHMLLNPRVTRFLDGVLEIGEQKLRLEDFVISKKSELAGLTLQEARLEVTVLALSHPEKPTLSHPKADTKLLPGVEIVVMGIDEELQKLAKKV